MESSGVASCRLREHVANCVGMATNDDLEFDVPVSPKRRLVAGQLGAIEACQAANLMVYLCVPMLIKIGGWQALKCSAAAVARRKECYDAGFHHTVEAPSQFS